MTSKADIARHLANRQIVAKRVKAKADATAKSQAAVTAPLTERGIQTQVNAAANLKYDPSIRASGQMDRQVDQWFPAYQAQIEQARQATAQGYAGAAAYNTNATNSTSALDASQRAADDARMQAQAQQRGTTYTPSQVAQQAAVSRRSQADQFGSTTQALGANQNAFIADKSRIAGGDQIQRHVTESAYRRGLQTQKGQYATTTKDALRENERKYQLERAAFGLNTQKAAVSAQQSAAALALKKAEAAQKAATAKTAKERDAYQKAHGLGPYKPGATPKGPKPKTPLTLTPGQNNTALASIDQAASLYGTYLGQPKYKDAALNTIAGAIRVTVKDPLLVAAGADLATQGKLTPATYASLKARGYKIPKSYLTYNASRLAGRFKPGPVNTGTTGLTTGAGGAVGTLLG